ncbi:exported protein of unknown function (plasmid) [Cupriavidus taiwanensis]|uniref:Uncharacterized protein n=1 Tax=Cupriavidus taiwanensis TaxID=164546 RepID=A0A375FFY9_9BURK|nr:exported protein of unknown function [Cupriavidus taiwanensis]SOZ72166.1 exported protein of unknown function [Cupriavidus taiwanensis]SOZ74464.1 exported protein of unknown function [Cupriavidus taiwanensis]SPA03392.1 exported protein of unknown function [Cupriavidus taiwanensis]SPA57134.1 exported protein of unknown function [Cupriavidus taiwanensis]
MMTLMVLLMPSTTLVFNGCRAAGNDAVPVGLQTLGEEFEGRNATLPCLRSRCSEAFCTHPGRR